MSRAQREADPARRPRGTFPHHVRNLRRLFVVRSTMFPPGVLAGACFDHQVIKAALAQQACHIQRVLNPESLFHHLQAG